MIIKGYATKIPFSPAEAQEFGLLAEKKDLKVYRVGRDKESLEECLRTFRDNPGELWVYGGYRVLAGSRDGIMVILKDLKRRKIVVVDKMNGERSDQHDSEMLVRALRQILGSAKMKGSKRFAAKIGATGGKTKGEKAQERRNAIMHEDIIRRLVWSKKHSWRELADILGKPWTASTLFRRYGEK